MKRTFALLNESMEILVVVSAIYAYQGNFPTSRTRSEHLVANTDQQQQTFPCFTVSMNSVSQSAQRSAPLSWCSPIYTTLLIQV